MCMTLGSGAVFAVALALLQAPGPVNTNAPTPRGVSDAEAKTLVSAYLRLTDSPGTPSFSLENYSNSAFPGFHFIQAVWDNPNGSANLGFFAVDANTADLWNAAFSEQLTSPAVARLQQCVRGKNGLSDDDYRKYRRSGPMCASNRNADAVPSAVTTGQPAADQPVKTTICELVNEPESFNGKMVEVRADAVWGRHGSGLTDQKCSSAIPWSFKNTLSVSTVERGEYTFAFFPPTLQLHPDQLDWKPIRQPISVTLRRNDEFRRLQYYMDHLFAKEGTDEKCLHCPDYEITSTVTGRFDYYETHYMAVRVRPGGAIRVLKVGFGPMGESLYQLVVQSVSDVVAKPIDPRVHERKQ
jgi:hypothetical protein